MEKKLTQEQIDDIKKREQECLDFLKEKQMNPAINMQMNNIGDDNFALKPILFLQDMKYAQAPEEKSKAEKVQDIVEAEVKEAV